MKISEIKSSGTFVDAAIAYIESLPDDEVLSVQELADRIGRFIPTNSNTLTKLKAYRCKVNFPRPGYVYGNPKALRALRKKLAL